MKQKALFLDRDGTLNIDFDFVHTSDEWEWIPGVREKLVEYKKAGYLLIVITNQSGIARGRFTQEQVDDLHHWVNARLYETHGIKIDAFYVAPWHPNFHDGKSSLLLNERKPATGLFHKAADAFQINFEWSVMAGDKQTDLLPALELGINPFLVKSRFFDDELAQWASQYHIPILESIHYLPKPEL